MVSKVRRDAVRAGLVAVAGVFSGTRGCLAFFASRLAPTGGCGGLAGIVWPQCVSGFVVQSSALRVVGLALSRASSLPQGGCVPGGISAWP